MKQFIRDYLTFNKRERNGIVILISIILLLLIYLNISDKFIKPDKVDFSKFENQIIAFNKQAKLTDSLTKPENLFTKNNINNASSSSNPTPQFFTFNPNNLDAENWKLLGLNDKQIQTIKNYEAKGGQFRTKEDVKKMYCINAEQYAQLEPYINIPPKPTPNYTEQITNSQLQASDFKLRTSNSRLPTTVELNSADSAYLTKVKGIGPFYAKAIIKYRQQLGGFAFKEQLMEIWKFDQEKFNAVKDYIIVDESEIKKININTCTAEQLKHPYISWNAANAIVNYRKQHGKYKKIEEIKNTDLVDDETYRKIVIYLTL
ncbi:MAG: helix-hairpin-helix domain-containing protein [Bacteroidia bacterium]